MKTIGCFISPHGYGHATRICAILEALNTSVDFEAHLYSTVDKSIFSQGRFCYQLHKQLTDIGFFQKDAFHLDIAKTCDALKRFIPFDEKVIDSLAERCAGHSFVLCDISALGIAVAARAGIASVLLENFTWDWLYAPYTPKNTQLQFYSNYLKKIYKNADYHIQTEPVCLPGQADLVCAPIFRTVREQVELVRKNLECSGLKTVLITLGGIGFKPQFMQELQHNPNYEFIITGQDKHVRIGNNVLLLDRSTIHYHPDLINLADLTVFKCGYSTLAECYQVGKPSLCIRREGFAESKVLESFIQQNMRTVLISQQDFTSGRWLELLDNIDTTSPEPAKQNGAEAVATFLTSLL